MSNLQTSDQRSQSDKASAHVDEYSKDAERNPPLHHLPTVKEEDDAIAAAIFAKHRDEADVSYLVDFFYLISLDILEQITAQEEKRLVRKLDLMLMPIMMITIALQSIDKGVLGVGSFAHLVLQSPNFESGGGNFWSLDRVGTLFTTTYTILTDSQSTTGIYRCCQWCQSYKYR